jgi:hypothetical protein
METAKEKILLTSIEQLDLNAECKSNLNELGISTLQEFINKGWKWLREQKAFDYVSFNMVIRFLDEKGLLPLLERKS